MDIEQKAAAVAGLQRALDVLSETDYGPVLAEWQEHLDSIAAALPAQRALIVSGAYPHANGDTWYMLADLITERSGPNGEPMYKTRDLVVPAFASPKGTSDGN